jgi:hypothetical protein
MFGAPNRAEDQSERLLRRAQRQLKRRRPARLPKEPAGRREQARHSDLEWVHPTVTFVAKDFRCIS